jgi:outer membrane protein OmpA-like peptidoglycan-associated protein
MSAACRALIVACMLCLLGLQGCATPPGSAAATAAAAPASRDSAAPRPAGLAAERQWLQAWFEGTPVRIEPLGAQDFSIEVPREFSFDTGRSVVKPPLGAVLDKLAQSLQRKPMARIELLAAPGDAAAASPLALQRAGSVRKHLLARGVTLQQLGPPTAASLPAVQLRIGLAAH